MSGRLALTKAGPRLFDRVEWMSSKLCLGSLVSVHGVQTRRRDGDRRDREAHKHDTRKSPTYLRLSRRTRQEKRTMKSYETSWRKTSGKKKE
jgi:hypothetical protein